MVLRLHNLWRLECVHQTKNEVGSSNGGERNVCLNLVPSWEKQGRENVLVEKLIRGQRVEWWTMFLSWLNELRDCGWSRVEEKHTLLLSLTVTKEDCDSHSCHQLNQEWKRLSLRREKMVSIEERKISTSCQRQERNVSDLTVINKREVSNNVRNEFLSFYEVKLSSVFGVVYHFFRHLPCVCLCV